MGGVLFRDAEVDGTRRVDVRVAQGVVLEVGPGLARAGEDEVVACAGRALLPGLCDHHVHLLALAAAGRSVRCGPPEVRDAAALKTALRAAAPGSDGWIRGVGYAESVAGLLDAGGLDAFRADVPVRVQHRSGALWILNTAAVRAAGLVAGDDPGIERDGAGEPTGRLWRADGWLRSRLPDADDGSALAKVGGSLTRYGITSVTDATPDLASGAVARLAQARASGALPQHVRLLGAREPLPEGMSAGPEKIVIADSALPTPEELATRIAAAHEAGRPVAVHCVTYAALVLLLIAFDTTGVRVGDRIEHAALVPADLLDRIRRLGLRVVTQPGFLADRGDDYLRDVPPTDHPDLYRCATLLEAGIPVALSSDAPYGPLDPWLVMHAAVRRRARSGAVVGPAERIPARRALDAYLAPADDPGGPARRIVPGLPADLVLLRAPLADALAALPDNPVVGAWFAGPTPTCGTLAPFH
ncbi:amidohydrolase family protein [Actinocorallia sp. API 0066]|uniref:amidohydrolase family protein n=1 Tax=Actinocorallia sp. API 0066 TaxID=2896846 RepID=UPI001E54779D|nr:amidohydrolase family protein [Actinocorallia sp. API 0066]MCD0448840.1 amidohydrolase family protein [Actinocorallia sp. API 0066]